MFSHEEEDVFPMHKRLRIHSGATKALKTVQGHFEVQTAVMSSDFTAQRQEREASRRGGCTGGRTCTTRGKREQKKKRKKRIEQSGEEKPSVDKKRSKRNYNKKTQPVEELEKSWEVGIASVWSDLGGLDRIDMMRQTFGNRGVLKYRGVIRHVSHPLYELCKGYVHDGNNVTGIQEVDHGHQVCGTHKMMSCIEEELRSNKP